MTPGIGPVVLFGSGETSASGRRVYDWLFSRFPPPVRMAILETPAGFQPNSHAVAEKVADFVRARLRNYRPDVAVVAARSRRPPLSTNDPELLRPLLHANVVFMGAGSPTYAVRHLEDSIALHYLAAVHRLGTSVVMASAAATAIGRLCLPVYEIYKVGEDLRWERGLDLFGAFGLPLTIVPHWDNSEGGAELDTSRCFVGRARFERLLQMLPEGSTVVGIEEHTALVLDLASGSCRVMGRGGVEILRGGNASRHDTGALFPAKELGNLRMPDPEAGLPAEVWQDVLAGRRATESPEEPPREVQDLIGLREQARSLGNWAEADLLRDRIAAMGWRLQDLPDGPAAVKEPADSPQGT